MAGANHFALLESDDPGDDTRLDNKSQQQPAANLAQELFGRAYPSARRIIRNRERQQSGAGPANARDDGAAAGGARAKNAQQGGARKQGQGGGRQANEAAVDDEAPAPRLYDLAQFPSLE
ncbi:hypothetical protein PAHAL_7G210700 [Panicum hallii]|jgi:hypothetical protein|uniref:Uncharacterized protein n=1 Tax=Panicum hallii TaxID=206008 RepID=A0A2T8ICY8_9POAL|nr:hypothetical protein PAHAL_7G210700 [Panicum hallii]